MIGGTDAMRRNMVELPIPHCADCRLLVRLLREARDRIPDWTTGVNAALLAEIDAALAHMRRE